MGYAGGKLAQSGKFGSMDQLLLCLFELLIARL